MLKGLKGTKARSSAQRSTVVSSVAQEEVPDTLVGILDHEGFREEFRAYLKDRFALESLLFFECVELYETIDANDHGKLKTAGEYLVDKFVREEAEQSVNLGAVSRTTLLDVVDFDPETFAKAKGEVVSLMASNFLEDFKAHMYGDEHHPQAPKTSIASSPTEYYARSSNVVELAQILDEDLKRYQFVGCACPSIDKCICTMAPARRGSQSPTRNSTIASMASRMLRLKGSQHKRQTSKKNSRCRVLSLMEEVEEH